MRVIVAGVLMHAASRLNAAPASDEVTSLPGLATLSSRLYSGYLLAGAGQHLHYVYSEAIAVDPTSAPLVLWFNGGPGCSSMEGAFSESGPYHVTQFSNPPTLEVNPWSWNNETNNLFIESPAGVGFSYCDTPSGCDHTDTSTAANNLLALLNFFTLFPELANRPTFITGESYAGIYVPMLAAAIVRHNQAGGSINLRGIMVGNGCIGSEAGHCGNDPLNSLHDVQTWRGHALIPQTLADAITAHCSWNLPSLECDALVLEAQLLTNELDIYDLYNTCPDPASPAPPLRAPVGNTSLLARRAAKVPASAVMARAGDPSNCFGSGPTIEAWFNQPEVKAAMHVAPGIEFALCSGNFTFNYNSDMADERKEIYPLLLTQANITAVIYNGDADLCVPHTDNEAWTASMGYAVTSPWLPWNVPSEHGSYLGGYRIEYAHGLTYATVRGAGHMVPETRPEAALELFKRGVLGKGF